MTAISNYYSEIRRNESLVGYWRLNDLKGLHVLDWAARHNLNGVIQGEPDPLGYGALILNDKFSGSALFENNGQKIEIPDITDLRQSINLSIEVWIVSYEEKQTSIIISKMGNENIASPYAFGLNLGAPFISIGNGIISEKIVSNRTIVTGVPTHLVVTKQNKDVKFYINGIEFFKSEIETLGSDNEQPLIIGSWNSDKEVFKGLLSEVAFYSGALSANSIIKHFKNGRQIIENTSLITSFERPSYK